MEDGTGVAASPADKCTPDGFLADRWSELGRGHAMRRLGGGDAVPPSPPHGRNDLIAERLHQLQLVWRAVRHQTHCSGTAAASVLPSTRA